MDKRERKLLKQTEVLGGYDPTKYQSERIYANSHGRHTRSDLPGL